MIAFHVILPVTLSYLVTLSRNVQTKAMPSSWMLFGMEPFRWQPQASLITMNPDFKLQFLPFLLFAKLVDLWQLGDATPDNSGTQLRPQNLRRVSPSVNFRWNTLL